MSAETSDRLRFDPWGVPAVPVLSRQAHDRIAALRSDEAFLERAWAAESSRVLVVSGNATVAAHRRPDGAALILLSPRQVTAAGDRVLLGRAEGVVYFAVLSDAELGDGGWLGLRELAVALDDLEIGLLTSAVALQAWHQRHPRCPRCGALTRSTQAGWTRRCPIDGSDHFPRTDPAVIMLIHDGAGRCVLARGPQWPPGRMSVLAGFVEAGESAEAAVAREVGEEVGIAVRDVAYVASQPHPFPSSLMLGFTGLVDGDPTLTIDKDEIVEAGWFTRAEVRRTVDWDADRPVPGNADRILRGLPPTMSIARQLINSWLTWDD